MVPVIVLERVKFGIIVVMVMMRIGGKGFSNDENVYDSNDDSDDISGDNYGIGGNVALISNDYNCSVVDYYEGNGDIDNSDEYDGDSGINGEQSTFPSAITALH